MKATSLERGQALIIIVFAIVALVGMTGLAVDGGMAYSDRRNAQNAADTGALAAALAYARGRDPVATANTAVLNAGFTNDGVNSTVTVTVQDLSVGECPDTAIGKDITVQVRSRVQTYFAPVLGIRQVMNTVRATSRSCDPVVGPLFPGNAIVALARSGIGFDAAGTPNWRVVNGGIFSNSSDSPSARCKGAADVVAPSITTVGGVTLTCSTSVPQITTGSPQYQYSDYKDLLPPIPTCDGIAQKIGAYWVAQAGADGSRVAFNGDMHFGPGLFCVTNSPGPYHGEILGDGVTFYLVPTNFSLKFNGGGNLTATAPLPDPQNPYAGVLMFSAPHLVGGVLQQTQQIDLRGNGTAAISGSVIVPSANVTMFGNSGGSGFGTQVIAYHVDSGGNSNIFINYNASIGYQTFHPAWLTLLR